MGVFACSIITGSIKPELNAFIAGHLGTGRCGNAREVMHSAMRLLEQNESQLKLSEVRRSIREAAER